MMTAARGGDASWKKETTHLIVATTMMEADQAPSGELQQSRRRVRGRPCGWQLGKLSFEGRLVSLIASVGRSLSVAAAAAGSRQAAGGPTGRAKAIVLSLSTEK